jgi:hypothetical protein
MTPPPAPRLLFVPVSGAFGMGEYARSLAIARAASERWPAAAVHFVLSRAAPYAAAAPFPSTLLPSSPTFHSTPVIELMRSFRPDVVLFDNAGRTQQLRAARALGARIVYISARRRQRRRAFRLSWMRLIDEHWIAYPEFLAGGLGFFERVKLRLLGRPTLRFLDVVLPAGDAARRTALLTDLGLAAGGYTLLVPGGGTGHPGVRDAAARFFAEAQDLSASGEMTVYVGPAPAAAPAAEPLLRAIAVMPQRDLAELMRAARVIVANGGSTLLQAIACAGACIGVPIARDQIDRIRGCVAAGVAVAATLEAGAIARHARELLTDEPARTALMRRAGALALADGIGLAVDAVAQLLDRSGSRA